MKVKKEFFVHPHNEANLITEAFGIDSGYIQKICDIDVPDDYDILYITGESGSGKSTILKELCPEYKNEDIPYNKPLFLWCGDTEEDKNRAISMLTLVGISDATMFVNYYSNLSDSQQARCRIMLELLSYKELIVIDEFLSTLDRKTAKSVAYCIQKAIRKLNKRAILVTAHNDLEDYIQPTYTVSGKSFPSRFTIAKYNKLHTNSILNKVEFFYGDKDVYRELQLAELHYKGKYTGGTKEYLFAEIDSEIVACLVSTYRRNDGGRRISRVVVHPSYRGVGLGVAIVKKYISEYSNADVIASMGLYNPVFKKAGMTRVQDSIIKSPSGLKKELQQLGFDITRWYSKSYCSEFCSDIENRMAISKYSKSATHLVQPAGRHLTADEIEIKIIESEATASRVLFGLRDRTMAKYINI